MNTNPTTPIAQQIAEAIDRLPLALQRLVLEFAEFLLSRLGPGTETANTLDTQENGDRPAVSNLDNRQESAIAPEATGQEPKNVWEWLELNKGTIEQPPDWSSQHNHYLYGTPKNNVRKLEDFRYHNPTKPISTKLRGSTGMI